MYSYDDANNCTGYTVKTGTDGANFFSVKKTGENTIEYGFGQTDYQSSSVITYDNNAFLDPRITQIALKSESWAARAGNLSYHYDKLGRLEDKTFTMFEIPGELTVTESIDYVYGTLLKDTVTTKLNGVNLDVHKCSYQYNPRGLPSEVVYEFSDDGEDALEEIYTHLYFYDKAERLTTETHRSGDNVQSISYSYNADGSLQKEMMGALTHRQYVYDKGRLTSYLDKDGNPLATFSYDNLGNCTGYETDEKEVSMEWERGSLMTKFERTETENGTEKSTETTYFYNSRKVRYKKIVDGIENRYYYDGEKLEAEYCLGNPEEEEDESKRAYLIRYLYDSEGITGIAVLNEPGTGGANTVYYLAKDGQGNVIAVIRRGATMARYEYDTWGKCKVLNWDGTENTDENFIGNINPIRWKSQYYDRESGMYYIGGRYYDPDIKRYISAVNPEEMLNRAGTVYGINPYLLTLTNPVNMVYNEYTIEPDGELSYDPDELDNFNYFWRYTWTKFWNSKLGKYIAVRLFVAATALAILCPAFLPTYISAVVGIGVSLGVGAIIAGIRSRRQGNGFWSGFINHLSENWSQEVAIGMAVALITFGISQAAQAMKKVGPHCFAAGTLVACRNADGEEIHKPIEEIEVGDEVLSYDEETGEQGYKLVVRLFRNQTKEWYHVFVDGEEIRCTGEHPFYVKGKGFIPAKELKSGDKCLLSTGEDVTIEKVEVETLTEAEITYNFEVADFHTYYVTEKDVLVHNTCKTTEIVDTVDDALTRAEEHLGKSQHYYVDKKGYVNKNILVSDADPRKIVRFDIDPYGHVKRFGPHLNLETYAAPFGTIDQKPLTNIHLYWRQ